MREVIADNQRVTKRLDFLSEKVLYIENRQNEMDERLSLVDQRTADNESFTLELQSDIEAIRKEQRRSLFSNCAKFGFILLILSIFLIILYKALD